MASIESASLCYWTPCLSSVRGVTPPHLDDSVDDAAAADDDDDPAVRCRLAGDLQASRRWWPAMTARSGSNRQSGHVTMI